MEWVREQSHKSKNNNERDLGQGTSNHPSRFIQELLWIIETLCTFAHYPELKPHCNHDSQPQHPLSQVADCCYGKHESRLSCVFFSHEALLSVEVVVDIDEVVDLEVRAEEGRVAKLHSVHDEASQEYCSS